MRTAAMRPFRATCATATGLETVFRLVWTRATGSLNGLRLSLRKEYSFDVAERA
jgi:hypothetical protein